MVKNHALKAAARARKAETGETLPEAMRKSDTTSKLVIDLGLGVTFDLHADTPHLFISGQPKTGKTTLTKHIMREVQGKVGITVFTQSPREYDEFPGAAMVDTGGRPESTDLMLDALATAARGGHQNAIPKMLVIDSIHALSEDSLINLQILARVSRVAGIYLVIVSQQAPEGVLKNNTHQIVAGAQGLYVLDGGEVFKLGEAASAEATTTLKIGEGATWDLETGHLMVVGKPGIGKTELAKKVALEALLSGKRVTVMTSEYGVKSWKATFGEAITVLSELSADAIDKVTADNLYADSSQSILIMDGIMVEDRRELTLNERIIQSAFINALRNGNFRIMSIGTVFPELGVLFENAVVLGERLPKSVEAVRGLSLGQIIGIERRNIADDANAFVEVGMGNGWLISRDRGVYERFSFGL